MSNFLTARGAKGEEKSHIYKPLFKAIWEKKLTRTVRERISDWAKTEVYKSYLIDLIQESARGIPSEFIPSIIIFLFCFQADL